MYTRCPACQAVYELQAKVLAEAAGVVRCGNCGKTFNSLSQLFENHPDESGEPLRGDGMPPMLEHPDMIQAELPVEHFDASSGGDGDVEPLPDFGPLEDERTTPAWLWPAVSAALAILLLVQLGVMWQTPGSPLARWLGSSDLAHAGLDPNETIQIVSRDMHRHPSLDDAVVISASLRNQADSSIPFPIIEVRFYDASQQVIGVRRLEPDAYLRDADVVERGLPADVLMPILMEFVIGSTEPAGFQMRFH